MSNNAKANDEAEYFGDQQAPPQVVRTVVKKVPRPPKSQWPASFPVKSFPWDRLVFTPARQSQKRKTAFFCGIRLQGAPFGYKLRMHLLNCTSPFGFSEFREDDMPADKEKWSYAISIDDPEELASLKHGQEVIENGMKDAARETKVQLKEYQMMLRESAGYGSTLRCSVPPFQQPGNNNAGEGGTTMMSVPATTLKVVKDGKVLEDPNAFKAWARRTVKADVLVEISSGWFVANKFGPRVYTVRLRPYDESLSDALFPDEQEEADAAAEEQEEDDTQSRKRKRDVANDADSDGKRLKADEEA